jgi:translation initiation factor IF-3
LQSGQILEHWRAQGHIPAHRHQSPWRLPIARRPQAAPPPKKEGPQINEDILAPRVLLIDEKGEKQGEMPIEAALDAAREASLDLVMVAPDNDPPVVKISDYGKQRFAEQKKKAEARKKQKSADLKEIKMRPNIDTHDYEVKAKAIRRFFEEGDKVKITLRFRGREMAHQHLGMELLAKVRDEFSADAKVEQEPKLEGRQMIMVLSPR